MVTDGDLTYLEGKPHRYLSGLGFGLGSRSGLELGLGLRLGLRLALALG